MGGWGWERKERKGIYVYIQLIHDVIQQKSTQHCKAIIFQQKKIFKLIEKQKQNKTKPHLT